MKSAGHRSQVGEEAFPRRTRLATVVVRGAKIILIV
jgi:hypothetical protein